MYFGFCDTVLVREDSEFEYIAQANQKRFRFRNHAIYNSFSMRSEEVDTSSIKILSPNVDFKKNKKTAGMLATEVRAGDAPKPTFSMKTNKNLKNLEIRVRSTIEICPYLRH